MTPDKKELVVYRLKRANEAFGDAQLMAENQKWNGAINRLYYAAFYAVTALLLHNDIRSHTHTGTKTSFSEHFMKTERLPRELGKMYSQLFSFRNKSDYDDLLNAAAEDVMAYFEPVQRLIKTIEQMIGH